MITDNMVEVRKAFDEINGNSLTYDIAGAKLLEQSLLEISQLDNISAKHNDLITNIKDIRTIIKKPQANIYDLTLISEAPNPLLTIPKSIPTSEDTSVLLTILRIYACQELEKKYGIVSDTTKTKANIFINDGVIDVIDSALENIAPSSELYFLVDTLNDIKSGIEKLAKGELPTVSELKTIRHRGNVCFEGHQYSNKGGNTGDIAKSIFTLPIMDSFVTDLFEYWCEKQHYQHTPATNMLNQSNYG